MSHQRILILENPGKYALELKHQLTGLGHEVIGIAHSGEIAVQLAGQLHPDLVLVDIQLQGEQDGICTASQITQLCNIPIIYLTSINDEITLQRVGKTKPYGYLLKPIGDQELRIAIEIAMVKHQAEQELQAQRDFAMQVMNTMGQGLTVTNAEGPFEFVNPAFAAILGLPVDEIIGKEPDDFTFAADLLTLAKAHNQRQQGETSTYETRLRRADGSLAPVAITGSPRWEGGRFAGAIAVVTDLAEPKRAEEELRKLSQAVRQSASTIVITDVNGNIEYVNPTFERITGYSANEALGNNPRILKSGEQSLEFYTQLWQTIKSGKEWRGEFHNQRKDGTKYWEEATISPIFNDQDQITHFIAVKEDVTAHKEAEETLRQTKEQLEAILQGIADGISVMNAQGHLIYVNDALALASGYPSAKVMTQEYNPLILLENFDILDEGGRPFPPEALPNHQVFRGLITRPVTVCYRNKATGEARWSTIQASPIHDKDGQVLFAVVITHDITERKQAEQAEHDLRLLAEALRSSSEALSSTLEFDAVLDQILLSLDKVAPYDAAAIMLLEDEAVRVVRYRGYGKYAKLDPSAHLGLPVSKFIKFLPGEQPFEPVMISDTKTDPHWIKPANMGWVRSLAFAPILVRGTLVGFLSLNSAIPAFYNSTHKEGLKAFANQAAIAIENARLYAQVQQLAVLDDLTRAYNRRGLIDLGRREIERAVRFSRPLSLLFLDIDHFKLCNDSFSYSAGDAVLRSLTECLHSNLREVDVLGRYGGEEFVILLPETDTANACLVAERLRMIVEANQVQTTLGSISITVSIGVAEFDLSKEEADRTPENAGQALESLLERAGEALHLAKAAGRNCIRVLGYTSDLGPSN